MQSTKRARLSCNIPVEKGPGFSPRAQDLADRLPNKASGPYCCEVFLPQSFPCLCPELGGPRADRHPFPRRRKKLDCRKLKTRLPKFEIKGGGREGVDVKMRPGRQAAEVHDAFLQIAEFQKQDWRKLETRLPKMKNKIVENQKQDCRT